MKKHVQLNLLGQPVQNLCIFCGYPKGFQASEYRCEFEIARHYEFNPFKDAWHVDLKAAAAETIKLKALVKEHLEKALNEDPKLRCWVEAGQRRAWVESKTLKRIVKDPQLSLVSYLISRSQNLSQRV